MATASGSAWRRARLRRGRRRRAWPRRVAAAARSAIRARRRVRGRLVRARLGRLAPASWSSSSGFFLHGLAFAAWVLAVGHLRLGLPAIGAPPIPAMRQQDREPAHLNSLRPRHTRRREPASRSSARRAATAGLRRRATRRARPCRPSGSRSGPSGCPAPGCWSARARVSSQPGQSAAKPPRDAAAHREHQAARAVVGAASCGRAVSGVSFTRRPNSENTSVATRCVDPARLAGRPGRRRARARAP